MEQKAREVLALGQRVGGTVSKEAPCIFALAFFLLMIASFLYILFEKTAL